MNNDEPSTAEALPDVDAWIEKQVFNSTADIKVPESLADQVIGQDKAVVVIKKAAEQKRHVMLIGEPGTGKSMLARSMTEYLPKGELQDVIAYHNPEDTNEPKIRIVPTGKGREIVQAQKKEAMQRKAQRNSMFSVIALMVVMLAVVLWIQSGDAMILIWGVIAAIMVFILFRYTGQRQENYIVPKLLITHEEREMPPFIDATGAHAGALLGDVKHDPFQSGGLETPAHERLEVGAIHKASKGVLFLDEINMLRIESQQSLLTALQEGKFSITGQSERSSGAMVKSEPVPCDFILVCAGNLDAVQGMHPALRSRIRGYGYEVYMKSTMDDTYENRIKLIRFVAQEVAKDKKIPHFDKRAVGEIVKEAQRRAGRKGQLTLRLRELGGLIRVAGDIAREENRPTVTQEHVMAAKKIARSLEQQIADRYLEARKAYKSFATEGAAVGMVNGLAALNTESSMSEYSGVVLPIVAEVTPAQTKNAGKIIATGKLGEIAKEAVSNVSAIIKKYTGEDISNHDVHVQFVGTYEGVEGDSASISVATAVISALEDVPVDQTIAMTGSLSVRGMVLPVGGVTAKIEAAAESGIKKVIIPLANLRDVVLEERYIGKIQIVPVSNMNEVLENALVGGIKKDSLLKKLASLVESSYITGTPRAA
ncbi:MAG: ATP-dependent protease LonB [Methanomassiliicoccales archaeon]|jgi:Lon-like ATP-dependent protease|nr:ATP-dependent protease LonB [Methanomassiliicoccales archaeon]MDD1755410.1 ATP-dependent protease LonB [Methanomassiliicoccales archaeon]